MAKANLTTANPSAGKKYTAGHGGQQSRAIPAAARSTQLDTANLATAKGNLATAKAVHGGSVP